MLVQVDWGLNYSETILTQTELKQEVVADAAALDSGLAKNGHMVVNGILFDTAKADLKPESKAALEQISKMLKQDPEDEGVRGGAHGQRGRAGVKHGSVKAAFGGGGAGVDEPIWRGGRSAGAVWGWAVRASGVE